MTTPEREGKCCPRCQGTYFKCKWPPCFCHSPKEEVQERHDVKVCEGMRWHGKDTCDGLISFKGIGKLECGCKCHAELEVQERCRICYACRHGDPCQFLQESITLKPGGTTPVNPKTTWRKESREGDSWEEEFDKKFRGFYSPMNGPSEDWLKSERIKDWIRACKAEWQESAYQKGYGAGLSKKSREAHTLALQEAASAIGGFKIDEVFEISEMTYSGESSDWVRGYNQALEDTAREIEKIANNV